MILPEGPASGPRAGGIIAGQPIPVNISEKYLKYPIRRSIYQTNLRNIDEITPECYTPARMNHSSRDLILRTLRSRGKCAVKDLADAARISPVSVRHHLANLQGEGLVEIEEIRHGVGRPRQLFSLTERAMDLFPSRYFSLTHRLLGEIKDTLPQATVEAIFSGIAATMADDYAETLAGLPIEQRLHRLVESLSREGFDAEVETIGDRILIRELSCPYFRMGREHPEVCLVDQNFIATALSVPVEKVTCLLDGHSHCTFSIPQESQLSEASHG